MFEHPMADYQDELELESRATSLGIKRYRDNLRAQGLQHSTVGSHLLSECIPAVATSIEKWVEHTKNIRGNQYTVTTLDFIKEFQGDYEAIAFITAQSVITSFERQSPITATAINLTRRLETELEYRHFREEQPHLYHKILRQLEKTSNESHRRKVVMHVKNKYDIIRPKWDYTNRLKLGVVLLELFCDSTGLAEIINKRETSGRTRKWVVPTDKCDTWLQDAHARAELMAPVYLPMVVPPRPWTSPISGGYISTPVYRMRFVKTQVKNYIEELKSYEMPEVYESINTMQETPWRINKGVYEVMKEVWESGGSLGKLPPREDDPLPAKPTDIDDNEEARNEWKCRARRVYEQNVKHRSKRIAMSGKLWLASEFINRDCFYYVWTLDWRGRAYPVASFVHPQADDSGKALLQFAEGKPLGDNGGYWLAVHIAGLFGEDKCSFDERVQWVQDHEEDILDSAMRPLDGGRFWTRADKPWCALAACYEWLGYSIDGDAYVSHLPVSMDGSCNGLQNFSAVLRDEIGGKAVNLTPSDTPQDIYTEVLRVVESRLDADSVWHGKVDRKIVKRPVMTLPYGATRYGMQKQILEELDKYRTENGKGMLGEDAMEGKECTELAGLVYESIGDVVIAARKAMDWLQEAARIAASEGLPIKWTTPMGFPVLQSYYKTVAQRVAVYMGTRQVTLTTQARTFKLNKRRMAQGIAPNVVHSWDAAHLMRTVLLCKQHGVDAFSMVHDSYGTHAGDVEVMAMCLRRAFVDQYSAPVLEKLRDEIQEQLPEDVVLPPLPEKGTLDLEQVMDSEFFFA